MRRISIDDMVGVYVSTLRPYHLGMTIRIGFMMNAVGRLIHLSKFYLFEYFSSIKKYIIHPRRSQVAASPFNECRSVSKANHHEPRSRMTRSPVVRSISTR
jgi:hypothetical protein